MAKRPMNVCGGGLFGDESSPPPQAARPVALVLPSASAAPARRFTLPTIAIAIAPDGSATNLSTTGMMIGAFDFATHRDERTTLQAGSKLYMFSDGCYEVSNADDVMMTIADFSGVLAGAATHADALDRIVGATQAWQQRAEFEDDFSLVEFQL